MKDAIGALTEVLGHRFHSCGLTYKRISPTRFKVDVGDVNLAGEVLVTCEDAYLMAITDVTINVPFLPLSAFCARYPPPTAITGNTPVTVTVAHVEKLAQEMLTFVRVLDLIKEKLTGAALPSTAMVADYLIDKYLLVTPKANSTITLDEVDADLEPLTFDHKVKGRLYRLSKQFRAVPELSVQYVGKAGAT